MKAAVEAFGRLDILVANAAIRPEASIDEVNFEDWRRVMALNLDSAFLLAKAALPALSRSDQAAVVTDRRHDRAVRRARAHSRRRGQGGLAGFGKALAHDLGPTASPSTRVSPGLIETRAAGAEPPRTMPRAKNPLGRRGAPEDVAAIVRMLVGPGARYITGQTVHVNGGALMV